MTVTKPESQLMMTSQASRASIEVAILTCGYRLGGSSWLDRDPKVWRSAGMAAVLVAALLWVVGTGDLVGRFGDPSTGGLLLVLALGLAAGVSTCRAMVGGIVLALSATAAERSTANRTVARTSPWRVNLIQGVLAEGRNVIELPKLTAGTYNYSRSMGMYSGRIVVIDPAPAS